MVNGPSWKGFRCSRNPAGESSSPAGEKKAAAIFGLVIPVALFSAALLMTVSLFAHSFKEAQTYLSVLMFIPMLPAMVLMVGSLKTKSWMMLIPTFGHNILVTDVIRGEPLNPIHIVIASAACIIAAATTPQKIRSTRGGLKYPTTNPKHALAIVVTNPASNRSAPRGLRYAAKMVATDITTNIVESRN